jgi:hypothetical protein
LEAKECLLSGCVFAEALAQICGKALLHDAPEETRQRGSDGNQNPEQGRKDETRNRDRFERDGETMGWAQLKVHREDVGDKLNPVNDDGGKKEGGDGESADADEQDIDGAGYVLTAAAVAAVGEMLVVIGAHGRREAGYVVTPSREDVSYHLVGAGGAVRPAVRWKC